METKSDTAFCSVFDTCVLGGDVFVKKNIRGSFTIEATVIVPMILFIFGILLHILFYYHDKNILLSTAHETATLELESEDMESYYLSRLEGKLLLFTRVECEAIVENNNVTIEAMGRKGAMATSVTCSMSRTEPENYIRNIRKMEKIGEGIVK